MGKAEAAIMKIHDNPLKQIKKRIFDQSVPCMGHFLLYNIAIVNLNCQSEVRIFGVKNEKYPKFTLTKEYGMCVYVILLRKKGEKICWITDFSAPCLISTETEN